MIAVIKIILTKFLLWKKTERVEVRCAWCEKLIRVERWEKVKSKNRAIRTSHGICKQCYENLKKGESNE